MTRTRFLAVSVVAGLAVVLTAGCSSEEGGEDGGGGRTGAALFEAAASAGDSDYAPLRSVPEAVEASDAIVVGRVTGASEAKVALGGGREWRYAILTVEVERTLSGEAESPVFAAVDIHRTADWAAIERDLPPRRVLLVLADLGDWQSDARTGFPETTYAPFTDGAWFEQEDGGLRGLRVDVDEVSQPLRDAMGSFDQLVEAFAAAGR